MLDVVYSKLSTDTELLAMVKGVYFNYPDSFTNLPVVSFYMIQDEPINTFEGEIGKKVTIAVDIWGSSALKNIQIAERVRVLLSTEMRREGEQDLFEENNIHHKSVKYVGTVIY